MTALRTISLTVIPSPATKREPDPAAAALAEIDALITEQTTPGEWAGQALCRDSKANLHFPAGREDSPRYQAQAEAAKSVCRQCPVRLQCLAHALNEGENTGIWGGTAPGQRRALRALRRQNKTTNNPRRLRPAS